MSKVCSKMFSAREAFTVSISDNFFPYLIFFVDGTLPNNAKEARRLTGTVTIYF